MERLSRSPPGEAREELLKCCGSQAWVAGMLAHRPFRSSEELEEAAASVLQSLSREDWLEAFAQHPKIGDLDSLRNKFSATGDWARGEQAGVAGAQDGTLKELAEGNRLYEERFGFIYIVSATGKSAEQMLADLTQRLTHDADTELALAAEQQLQITLLRLRKLAQT
ncbi:MAG: 2-oxo-4-hydroxy-4-carboxy-5-ureidoimidazoline decarboxylase [Candidatus Neomarinimicrobiota bacterium]